MDLITHVESMCDPDTDAGEWINRIDLREKGPWLLLMDMKQIGECGVECRTVAKACEEVMGDRDTDLAEHIVATSPSFSDLSAWLCSGKDGVCEYDVPEMPKDRPTGPAFKALTAEELQLRDTTRTMKQQGLSGQVFDRDTLQEQLAKLEAMGIDRETFEGYVKEPLSEGSASSKPPVDWQSFPEKAAAIGKTVQEYIGKLSA